jgi:hypothetical protein
MPTIQKTEGQGAHQRGPRNKSHGAGKASAAAVVLMSEDGMSEDGMSEDGDHAGAASPQGAAPSERLLHGKTLRDAVPREAHAGWRAPKHRRDPIDLLLQSNEFRVLELIPIRFGRMMQSTFSFYRGSASVMAVEPATTARSGLRGQAGR